MTGAVDEAEGRAGHAAEGGTAGGAGGFLHRGGLRAEHTMEGGFFRKQKPVIGGATASVDGVAAQCFHVETKERAIGCAGEGAACSVDGDVADAGEGAGIARDVCDFDL